MTATTLLNLITAFELKSVGHSSLEGAMISAFGFDWETVPEYREVSDYVSKCMTYDAVSGEWY